MNEYINITQIIESIREWGEELYGESDVEDIKNIIYYEEERW